MREVLREELKSTSLIISSRAPREDDVYSQGTVWMDGNEKYTATKVIVSWVKQGQNIDG